MKPLNHGYVVMTITSIPNDVVNIINLLMTHSVIWRVINNNVITFDVRRDEVMNVIETLDVDLYNMGGHYVIVVDYNDADNNQYKLTINGSD